MNVNTLLPFMSHSAVRPFPPPVAQEGLELEVAHCVGGVLSPLLTNVLLDDVDKELERRDLSFCRYADDANVYVASKRAGERVMTSLRKLYAKLRLTINEDKSAVAPVEERQFLGFTLVRTRGGKVKRRIADKALAAMKDRVREVTGRNSGRSLSSIVGDLRRFLVGWIGYFRSTEVRSPLHELDSWIRRRLRVVQLKQWRCGRTVFAHLRARGVAKPIAALIASRSRRYWWVSHQRYVFVALPDKLFDAMGVPRLAG